MRKYSRKRAVVWFIINTSLFIYFAVRIYQVFGFAGASSIIGFVVFYASNFGIAIDRLIEQDRLTHEAVEKNQGYIDSLLDVIKKLTERVL